MIVEDLMYEWVVTRHVVPEYIKGGVRFYEHPRPEHAFAFN